MKKTTFLTIFLPLISSVILAGLATFINSLNFFTVWLAIFSIVSGFTAIIGISNYFSEY